MTVMITLLKKSSRLPTLLKGINVGTSLLIGWFCCYSTLVKAQEEARLPIMQNIGIIPIQYDFSQSDSRGLQTFMDHMEMGFSEAVRQTHRFQVLNDTLVKSLWSTPNGRHELVKDFELHAFANAVVVPTADSVILMARVLDPNLKSLLQESETLNRSDVATFTYDQALNTLRTLVFRLFNRLPVDVTITSIQGKFVTLSGGINQGLNIGDEIELIRPSVQTRHPANHTWLSFSHTPLGTAKIVDAKAFTSVARLTMLNRENAAEIGDGSKIKTMPGRSFFARQSIQASAPIYGETIIVEPLYPTGSIQQAPKFASLEMQPENLPPAPVEPSEDPVIPEEKTTDAPPSAERAEDSLITPLVPSLTFEQITIHLGQSSWTHEGPGSTNSKIEWYLPINSLGATVTQSLYPGVKYDIGGGLTMGSSESGTYSGYRGQMKIYYHSTMNLEDTRLTHWRAGASGQMEGIGVINENYGGGDFITGSLFAGLYGNIALADVDNLDWSADFTLTPLTIGRIGYFGKTYTIRSSMGWSIDGQLFMRSSPRAVEWGFGLGFGQQDLLDSASKEIGASKLNLELLARYRF